MKAMMAIYIGIISLATISLTYITNTKDTKFTAQFLNIGQGDSTLITTPQGKRILIDGGPDTKVIEHLAKLIPLYNKRIDLIILTHPHKDHIFGLISTMKRYNVENTLIAGNITNSSLMKEFIEAHKKNNTKILIADPRYSIRIDKNTEIDNLSQNSYLTKGSNQNNKSIITKITHKKDNKQITILFTGDAEKKQEERITKNYPQNKIKSDIYQVGHHGSKTSSTLPFLQKVKPQISILSYGEGNMFHHPDDQTIQTLKKIQTHILHTADTDRINIQL